MHTKLYSENLMGKENLGNPVVNERPIIKHILIQTGGRGGAFIGFMVGSCS
jgi:hypothetical protein